MKSEGVEMGVVCGDVEEGLLAKGKMVSWNLTCLLTKTLCVFVS